MFEDSLVDSAARLRSHNRWPVILSLSAQLLAAAALLSLPLLHPETLPLARALSATLSPPRPPAPPPPAVHLKPQPGTNSNSASAPAAAQPTHSILRDLLHPSGPPVEAPPLAIVDLGIAAHTAPPGINTAPPSAPRVNVAPTGARSSTGPTRISSGVSAGLLLAPIRPDYPPIARLTRTEGTVLVEAVISRTGAIESARVLSGPAVLQAAALTAVLKARYRPFLLNGQPTEVQTTFTIHFRMGN